MSDDQFVIREKALEEEFFARENAKLKESFQQKLRDEQASAALAKASGITDEVVLQHMVDAGLRPETAAAFALLPLIFTAWADGQLDEKERAAVMAAAREESGIVEHGAAHELFEHWLTNPPPHKLWRVWCEYARALARTLPDEARRTFVETLIGRAERVAKASGGLLGLGEHISRQERELLDYLSAALD